jgi:hypothetical protein
MNRLLFLYVLIAGLPLMAQIPTNGLKGHYPFDGTLTDYSSNGNDIVTGTGTYVDDRFGNANAALSLDGITDSLVLPIAEFSPIQGDFTISFWYKTNSPNVMNLFSSKQTPADTTNNFELQLSSHNRYYLENYKQVFYQTYAYWNGSGIASNAVAEGAPGLFTKGEWSHFAISREADTFRIYRNHQLSYLSVETNFGGTIGDAVAFIFSASPYHFKGTIDDLRLYDRFLEPNEIDVLWFENAPFIFSQVKPTDAYVQGSNVFVAWDYDTTQISDSILVEYRVNNGAWTPSVHSNLAYEYYTYIDMSYAYGTTVEVRVSDFTNPALTQTTGQFSVSEYDWEEVDDTLPFDAKDGAGLLTFQNKMWLLGGWDPPHHEPTYTHSQVWSSTDGANWVFETDAPWPPRHAAAWLVANDAMWVIGGDPQSGCLTDVWKSSDGINWTQTNNAIPGFVNRNNQNYAAINDQLFVYGGEQCSADGLNEVWRSNDGITWNQLPNAPWSGRGMQVNSCVDGSGQLWMLGGSNEGTRRSYNEVWKSADGINWTLVNESAPWNGRYWHTVAWFDNKMWLMGGIATGVEVNDVWYSEDGINWKELKSTTGNWPDGTRHAQSTTVYDNALWYMCGISTNNSWKIRNMETLGLETMKESSLNLNVFPNPTKEQLTISFSCVENQPNTIQVVNVLGVVMKEVEMTVSASNCTVQLNTRDFPDGVYIVHAKNQQHQSVKFVKQ